MKKNPHIDKDGREVKKITYLMTSDMELPHEERAGLFKIGETTNINKRLKQLQTANPSIRVVKTSDKVSEKTLHEEFKAQRIMNSNGRNSEWFKLDERLLAICFEMMDGASFRDLLEVGLGDYSYGNSSYGCAVEKYKKYKF